MISDDFFKLGISAGMFLFQRLDCCRSLGDSPNAKTVLSN